VSIEDFHLPAVSNAFAVGFFDPVCLAETPALTKNSNIGVYTIRI
jgi:hypothetical protein